MKVRFICLLLVTALLAAFIPAPVSAASAEAMEIEKQISSTYRTALRSTGMASFNGYCGKLVSWQTYLLGIDESVYGCNGQDQFDLYRNLGTTTGGYRVKSYPASQYNLQTALNEITKNGTVDAYNILVGFQRTNTREGSIYGHALLIHAILDGTVYFVECYSTAIDGKYWAEGTPISCSIDTFCEYYNAWTVFDGIAYFGLKTYADVCEVYPASIYAMAQENAEIYEEPFDPGIYDAKKTGASIASGEIVKVTGLLKTPGGEYWYRLEGERSYVPARTLVFVTADFQDVQIANLRVPGVLRKGYGFVLQGEVYAVSSGLDSVNVVVYDPQEGMENPIFSGSLESSGQSVNLNHWKLDQTMKFRTLTAGTYRIAIMAEVGTHLLEDGAAVYFSETREIWHSQLEVTAGWENYVTVEFDGNGGTAEIAQTVLPQGSLLENLPQATTDQAVFKGWTLDPEGTQPVISNLVITSNTTLYAQWETGRNSLDGWQAVDGEWVYYDGGEIMEGWIALGGVIIYQYADGTRAKGLQQIGTEWYQFSDTGILTDDWQNVYDRIEILNAINTQPEKKPVVNDTVNMESIPVEEVRGLGIGSIVLILVISLAAGGAGAAVVLVIRKKRFVHAVS